MTDSTEGPHPHGDQPVITSGAPADAAEVAFVLLHGRGATAQGITNLAEPFYRHGVRFFAPQASRSRWYPHSFLAPREQNEPHLSSALRAVESVLEEVAETGIPPERTVLFGFSQGACLASEFAAQHPQRYAGVVAFSGGLIGESVALDRYEGSFEGTPAFFGCGDHDDHIPEKRVHESARIYRELDADVTKRIYEGMGHRINDDEVAYVESLLDDLLGSENER